MTQLFAGWDLHDTALYRVGSVCHGSFPGEICLTQLFAGWDLYDTQLFSGWDLYDTQLFAGWDLYDTQLFAGWDLYGTALALTPFQRGFRINGVFGRTFQVGLSVLAG